MNALPLTVLLLPVGCWDTEDAERPLGGSGGVGLVAANPKGVSEPKLVCCEEEILERPAESRSSFWSSKTIRNRRAVTSYLMGREFLYGNRTLHIAYTKTCQLTISHSIYFTTSLYSIRFNSFLPIIPRPSTYWARLFLKFSFPSFSYSGVNL